MIDPTKSTPLPGQMQTTAIPQQAQTQMPAQAPLISAQDRWKEFFAMQGRQMPTTPRPPQLPAQAAPQAQQQAIPGRPLYSRLLAMPNPPRHFWGNMMWRMARQAQQQQPQGTQEVSRQPLTQPRTGFFGRRAMFAPDANNSY